MYGLKPVPFKLKPVPFKLKPVPFKLKPVPFVQSDSCSACAGVETRAYQPIPFKTHKQSPVFQSAA